MRHVIIYFGKSSGEKLFARMLTLELEEAGIRCGMSSDISKIKDSLADKTVFTVVSADALTENELAFIAQNAVKGRVLLYGKEDRVSELSYLKRPFLTEEFVSLVKSRLEGGRPVSDRNTDNAQNSNSASLSYDETSETFFFGNEEIKLTARENMLLLYLYQNRGKAVSRLDAAKQIFSLDGSTNAVDVYISYLRKKIDCRFNVKTIYTVRNSGYMLK